MSDETRLTFKEMCAKFDVTPRTLRYYEYIELLQPEREGRSRFYSAREIARMTLIMRGRRWGFPCTHHHHQRQHHRSSSSSTLKDVPQCFAPRECATPSLVPFCKSAIPAQTGCAAQPACGGARARRPQSCTRSACRAPQSAASLCHATPLCKRVPGLLGSGPAL